MTGAYMVWSLVVNTLTHVFKCKPKRQNKQEGSFWYFFDQLGEIEIKELANLN